MKTSPFQAVMHRRATTMEKYLAVIIVVYIAVVSLKNPLFFTPETLFDMIRSGSGTMLLALGVLMVLVSGGIDVSFPVVAVVSSYLAVMTLDRTGINSIWLALVVSIAIGTVLGTINALLIHFLRLPTLIVTLGTASVFHGLMAVVFGTNDYTTGEMPTSLLDFGNASLLTVTDADTGQSFSLTVFLPITLAAIAGIWFVLYRTMLGRSIFAIGGSVESARRIGINVRRTQFFVYVYVGALAGLAGIIHASMSRMADPFSLVGQELSVIAAVVLGGARLIGGYGTLTGTLLGVALIVLVQNSLIVVGIPSTWQSVTIGLLILIGTGVPAWQAKRAAARAA
jgi:simple sugar transport system permease protein